MRFSEQRAYIGNLSQVLNSKTYRLEEGWAQGVRATDVSNAAGLSFTVVADRCMDLAYLSYKGINMSYLNPCGIVSPFAYHPQESEWMRGFTAGFVTTCGLDNIGSPSEGCGMHGRISNTPAKHYSVVQELREGEPVLILRGEMDQSVLFGENLTLRRKIEVDANHSRIVIEDTLENHAFAEQEFMLLYHFNLGYPFLTPDCQIYIPNEEVQPRDAHARDYLSEYLSLPEPTVTEEMCYYHRLKQNEGTSTVGVFNRALEIGMTLTFENHLLDHFIQWKNPGKGAYVLGLEPATNYVEGREVERKRDGLKKLGAGEQATHRLLLDFYDEQRLFSEKMV